jgi:hypothetical protein
MDGMLKESFSSDIKIISAEPTLIEKRKGFILIIQ